MADRVARVLIVDDHVLFAEAVRMALNANGFEVVAVVPTVEGALREVGRRRPELVLLDIGLPDGNGITVGRSILDAYPETHVVALSAITDARTVREALQAGLHGYVVKDTPIERLVESMRSVLGGQVVVPRAVSSRVAGGRSSEDEAVALLVDQLTAREREVLALMAQGLSNAGIARQLVVTEGAVEKHVRSIFQKLRLAPSTDVHRRVVAALTYLEG
jgi:DNA-binding NarL/FixJ family response regulator